MKIGGSLDLALTLSGKPDVPLPQAGEGANVVIR